MFGSKRSLFGAERGSTTSWLAGVTSVALLLATVALPAVAAAEEQPSDATNLVVAEGSAVIEEPPVVEEVVEEPPVVEEVVEVPVVVEEVVEEPPVVAVEEPAPTVQRNVSASDDSAAEAQDDPTVAAVPADAAVEPAKDDSTSPAQGTASAGTPDGSNSSDNAPPISEQRVAGQTSGGDNPPRGKGSIEVLKVDKLTNKPLAGAWFQLWKDDQQLGLEKSDSKGKATFEGLAWGTYQVQEVTAPDGYGLSDPATQTAVIDQSKFKCGDDHGVGPSSVEALTNNNNNEYGDNDRDCGKGVVKLTFKNPPLGSIEVLKVDKLTNKPLAGAWFQLWKDDQQLGLEKSDSKGKATFEGLAWGTYQVQEVTAPDGYGLSDPATQTAVIDQSKFKCGSTDDHNNRSSVDALTYNNNNNNEHGDDDRDCGKGVVKLTFKNPPLGSIEVLKVDKLTNKPLAGAWFQLWKDDQQLGLEKSDSKGKATFEGLAWGTYQVQEVTAPDGYGLSDPATQTAVIDQSKFKCGSTDDHNNRSSVDALTYNNNNNEHGDDDRDCGKGVVKLTFKNPPLGSIEVLKLDKLTGKALAGAKFQLWKGAEYVDEETSDSKGKATFKDLPWGTYQVQEVTAPDGYGLSDPATQTAIIDQSKFKCGDDHGVGPSSVEALTNNNSHEYGDNDRDCGKGVVKLTFKNPPLGSIEVLKVDKLTNKPLKGAWFQLWNDKGTIGQLDSEDTRDGELQESDEDGKVLFKAQPWGTYLVQEVSPPTGYGLSAPATQPAEIDESDYICDKGDRVDPSSLGAPNNNNNNEHGQKPGSGHGDWNVSCSGGVVELVFANPPIDIPSLDKTSDPSDGTAVETGGTIAYTIKVKNEGALPLTEQTLVDTLPTGTTLDLASVTPAGDTDVAGKITWTFDLGAFSEKTFTYTVKVTAGFGSAPLVNRADWVQKELTRTTTNPVKAINIAVGSFCEADTPFYSLKVGSQNLPDLPVKVEWLQANADGTLKLVNGQPVAAFNPATNQPYIDNYTLTNGQLNLPRNLWKGAELDSTGKIVKWPGWILNTDGSWSQVPDGGVRPATILRISVNPTVDSTALYPPATPECNANPPAVTGLDKSATPASGSQVSQGQAITYKVELTNRGGQATTSDLVDTLPAGVTYQPGSATRNGATSEPTVAGQTLTWPLVTVPVDDPATTGVNEGLVIFSYQVKVNSDAANGLTLVNTASWARLTDTTIHGVNVPPVAPVADIEDEVVVEDVEDEEVVAAEEDEELADTGANNVGNLVGAALLAMLAGGLMVTFGRRRREE